MKNKFKHAINYYAVQIALPSIIIGAFCLLIFKKSSDMGFVGIGYFLSIVVGAVNTVMLLPLLLNTVRRAKDYPEHLKALSLLLINIPISGIYLEII